MCPKHQKTIRQIVGRANFEKPIFFHGLSGWVLCKTEPFAFFAYTAYIRLGNHCNNKKYVTVGKIFPRAVIPEQFHLSSSIRSEVTLV